MAREEGPFEYFDERTSSPGVTANSIRSNLTDPEKNNGAIVAMATTLNQDGKTAAAQVEGDIDEAVRNHAKGAEVTAADLGKNGAYALGLMRSFAESVETFDDKVSHCNWKYRTDLASAMRWAGQAAASTEDPNDDKEVTEAKIGPGIESQIRTSEYNPAWTTLDTSIEGLITDFNSGPSNERVRELIRQGLLPMDAATLYPGLTLTEEDKKAYYKNVLGTMSPEEQKQWIEENLDHLDPAVASVVDPSVQEYFAQQVANDIEDPGNIDDRTVTLLNFFQKESAFSHELFTTVTPEQLAGAVSRLSSETFPTGASLPNPRMGDLYLRFLEGAGSAFATFTKGEGDYAPPANLRETWFNAITYPGEPIGFEDSGQFTGSNQGSALTLLLKYGGQENSFDPDFLGNLTSDLYEWERDGGNGGEPGDAVWGPLLGNDRVSPVYDPQMEYGDEPGESWDDTVTNGGGKSDGLANILAAMKNTPEASVIFFNDGQTVEYDDPNSDNTLEVNERLKYLLTERRWPSDNADGLGIALEGATLHNRNNGEDGQTSASLASQTMFMLASEIQHDDGFQVSTGMTDSIGRILAGYTPDTYRTALGDGDSVMDNNWIWGDEDSERPNIPGEPAGMRINGEDLSTLIRSIGREDDKTGLDAMTSTAVMYNGALNNHLLDVAVMPDGSKPANLTELQTAMVPDPRDPSKMVPYSQASTSTASNSGQLLGEIMGEGYLGGKAEEKADQEDRERWAKAFGAATSIIPSPQGQVAKFLTTQGLSLIQSQMSEQPASMTDAWASKTDGGVQEALRIQSYNTMLQHGLIDPDDPGGLDTSVEGVVITDPDTGQQIINPTLYDEDPDNNSSAAQTEFNSWLAAQANSGPSQATINAFVSSLPQGVR